MTRLIDADALSKEVSSTTLFIKDAEVFQRMINDAPTIATPYQPYTEIKPITEGGDLISRAGAIEAVKETLSGNVYWDYVCDALKALKALPSAEAVQGWIPFTRRPMTEEEQKDYPNCTFIFDCVLPDDGDEILVSNGRFVWMDTFCNDIDGCYLDGGDDIDEDMAWMPLPKPYKGGDE